jgi:glycine cleavage system H lipoate-binding protein
MYASLPVDLFVTKSAEYLLVIGFLCAFLLFWRVLARRREPAATPRPAGPFATTPSGWFGFPLERFYHAGHGWAQPAADGLVTVGIDDFAQKLVGRPERLALPAVGAELRQGRPMSRFEIGGRGVDLTAPLDGEVVEVNQQVVDRHGLVNEDPYGAGWLLRVRPARFGANTEELLEGSAARSWMNSMEDSLRQRMAPSFGLLLQDGGVPVSGIARALAGADWDQLASEYLQG